MVRPKRPGKGSLELRRICAWDVTNRQPSCGIFVMVNKALRRVECDTRGSAMELDDPVARLERSIQQEG
jgi:hypothetical protein